MGKGLPPPAAIFLLLRVDNVYAARFGVGYNEAALVPAETRHQRAQSFLSPESVHGRILTTSIRMLEASLIQDCFPR